MSISKFLPNHDRLPEFGSVGRDGWYQGGVCKSVAGAKRSAKANLNGPNDDGFSYMVVVQTSTQEGFYSWFFKQEAA